MKSSIVDQLIEQLSLMPKSSQRQVLQFARMLSQVRVQGTSGQNLLRFAASISNDELTLMQNAIKKDCEQVDLNEW